MYKTLLSIAIICCLAICANAQNVARIPEAIIFDSDMGPDYDDVGAIAMLHAFADKGEAKILATMASTNYPGVAGVMSVFNTYFKRPGIPIGVPKGKALDLRDWQHWTDTVLAKYPHKIKTNTKAWDAVKLYRKILAAQPNGSVTIVTIGFLTNMSDLLKSRPDEYSQLDGRQLVAKKVKHLVSMAGKFPEGWEFNVMKDAAASQNAFDNWPTPVILSGFEIGEKIKVGLPLIHNPSIRNSPVKDVFRICIPMAKEDSIGRKSWDETAVLVAVRGYELYYSLMMGRIKVADAGNNTWDDNGDGHAYLVEKMPAKEVEAIINELIMHQPK
ncbi:nucleoside hydrolase [Mucilaginibacter psychrotolerans]|uniref:Nucleoside hydrolase n=1 Tax=Mucilaginibacter psychrotolerans TaxID=1524096 RepID=A0A4Y8S3V2_9SPHI|nr:nucleoside hydrolase [Mucilaginibacter psychrotolerans]TFF33623.1 nucleoside hydrolase [Mucilaginibacter psychrotolerans]